MRFCLKIEIAPNKSTSRHRDQLSCKKLRLCSHLVPQDISLSTVPEYDSSWHYTLFFL